MSIRKENQRITEECEKIESQDSIKIALTTFVTQDTELKALEAKFAAQTQERKALTESNEKLLAECDALVHLLADCTLETTTN